MNMHGTDSTVHVRKIFRIRIGPIGQMCHLQERKDILVGSKTISEAVEKPGYICLSLMDLDSCCELRRILLDILRIHACIHDYCILRHNYRGSLLTPPGNQLTLGGPPTTAKSTHIPRHSSCKSLSRIY